MQGINSQNAMKDQELLKYIKSAIELETDVETQELIAQDYDTCRDAIKPQFSPKATPSYPQLLDAEWAFNEKGTLGVFLGSAIMFLFILLYTYGPLQSESGSGGIIFFEVLLILACIIGAFMYYKRINERVQSANQSNDTNIRYYEEEKARIETENATMSARYKTDIYDWENTNTAMHEKFSSALSASTAVLDKLYALDFIYPKYRNLPALTSIYEYFMTGRCTTLEGPNGAYNLYETELRMDTVISQLNTVIENLEAIKQNQYMLYQQVRQMKETLGAIHQEIGVIRGCTIEIATLTALNTYYNAISARNAQIMTLYHLL